LVVTLGQVWTSSVEQDQMRAEQLLRDALERDPNRSMARFGMGSIRRLQNRLAESQIELEKAIALDPNNALAMLQLGTTLKFLGGPEAEIPYIENAIGLNPRDPNIASCYRELGICHLLLNQVGQAIDLLRAACSGNPRVWFFHL
jgi:Tfp pilus assembly protein PilF